MDRETTTSTPVRKIRRGDILWVEADTSRGSVPGAPHPHVVVQEDVFNQSRISTVVVCALSSNLQRAGEPGVVHLEAGEGDMPRPSVVIASQVSSIYKTRLGRYIGALSAGRVDSVVAALGMLQRSFGA